VLIDPNGLLYGERIGACSDEAQLHFPRLLAASNGYGRFELNYPRLVQTVYGSLKKKPSKELITRIFHEYYDRFLLYVYQAQDGSVWGQWDIPQKYLPKYKTAGDASSPQPVEGEFDAFRRSYIESRRQKYAASNDQITFSERFGKLPKSSEGFGRVPRGIGVGIGGSIGIGVGEEDGSEPSGSSPLALLPTNRSDETFPVMPADVETWKRLYPAVDVLQELRSIEGWLIANPTRRKTAKGMPRFIANWLSEEQNKGGARAASGRRGAEQNPAGGRNERSASAIRGAFDAFRGGPGSGADGADQTCVPAAGDSAGDGADVGSGVDCAGGEVRPGGDGGRAGRAHAGVTVLSPAGGDPRAHRGEATAAVHGICAADAATGTPAYGPG